jgi:hypothetical protein
MEHLGMDLTLLEAVEVDVGPFPISQREEVLVEVPVDVL